MKGNRPKGPAKDRVQLAVVLRYGFRCNTCHRIPTYPTVDYIIPKFLGRTDKKENLQILCLTCHRHKDLYIGRWLPLMYKEKIKGQPINSRDVTYRQHKRIEK